MWPWEHLAFGYLLYSFVSRRLDGHVPRAAPAVVLAVATVLPDLVDKPLAWGFGVLPSGRSFAHSLFVAIPLSLLVFAAFHRRRPDVPTAFTVGYFSHLAGDVIYPLALRGTLAVRFLFWPVVPVPSSDAESLLLQVEELFAAFLQYLSTPAGTVYVGLEVLLLVAALVRWNLDGRPGLGAVMIRLRGRRSPE